MSIAVIYHSDCALHHAGPRHPEAPARIKAIHQALQRHPFPADLNFLVAPMASREALIQAHEEDYVDWVFSIAPTKGMVAIDNDTWMCPDTLNAARLAAGSAIHAVDLLMEEKAQAAFCNVRPPGHHAERDKAMGFCFFNNVAVGAMHAIKNHGLERIAIIDFDVHHGNGTQQIFQEDDRVLYCSSFEHPFYPGYDPDMDNDHLLSVPLPAGTGSALFRERVQAAWFARIASFRPQLVFFSAGFDGHADDPLADLSLSKEDYVWLTTEVAKLAHAHCQGKIISCLEGGYNLAVLADCVPAHVAAMAT